jgi:hypothetical protein
MDVAFADQTRIAALDAAPGRPPYETFLDALTGRESSQLVENVATTLKTLSVSGGRIPVSINDGEYANSYVCSPYSTLVTYALEELNAVTDWRLRVPLTAMVRAGGAVLRACNINAAVGLNNWLVSTTPHSCWRGEELDAVLRSVSHDYPRHYILLRSIDEFQHQAFKHALIEAGCHMIPVRQVYYLDVKGETWLKRRNTQRDLALLQQTEWTELTHDDFAEADFPRLCDLYRQLYIQKYSEQNPKFTAEFIRICHETRIFRFLGLRGADGTVQAFAALHVAGDVMTIPFIGYDLALAQNLGCYRMIMAMVTLEAAKNVTHLNCGAGAGAFKRSRGAAPHTEYLVVYDRHLPVLRRLPYYAVAYLMDRIGKSIMLDYGL